jgi:hypothetical protein
METSMRTSLALFSAAAALVLAVGGGGIAAASTTTAAAGATNPSVNVGPAAPAAPTPPAEPNVGEPAGAGVHIASLVGCITGLNC